MARAHRVEEQAHGHDHVSPVRGRHDVDEPRRVLVGDLRALAVEEALRRRRERQARGVRRVLVVPDEVRKPIGEERHEIDRRRAARALVADDERVDAEHALVGGGQEAHRVELARADAAGAEVGQAPRDDVDVREAGDLQAVVAESLVARARSPRGLVDRTGLVGSRRGVHALSARSATRRRRHGRRGGPRRGVTRRSRSV